ncbi:MAG: carotenoid biosynthesis protein [Synechococcales cyanobacterium]
MFTAPRFAQLERYALSIHIGSLFFGLAGLLIFVPHGELVAALPEVGQQLFSISMGNGGVVYMVFGMVAAMLFGRRLLGWRRTLMFMIPAIAISLSSELLGTSTGIPFGFYGYLTGLGYKIAGLVPFTIPLSWFYMGLSSFLLARTILKHGDHWLVRMESIALGALLLTSWDFVLDPAMTQAQIPFWQWFQPGPFFGMPLQNFGGWMLTGSLFMAVASLLWHRSGQDVPVLRRDQLAAPLVLYVANFSFALALSLGSGIYLPLPLGLLLGLGPALGLWWMADAAPVHKPRPIVHPSEEISSESLLTVEPEVANVSL